MVDDHGTRQTITAPAAEYDLLRDTAQAAVGAAVPYLTPTAWVSVTIYKTTQARGRERDRSYSVTRDRRGRVVYL